MKVNLIKTAVIGALMLPITSVFSEICNIKSKLPAIIFVGDVVSLNFHQTIKNPMRLQGVL